MIVEIRPIETKKWHGKEGKDSFAVPKVVEVLYDPEAGGYATGLTDEEAIEYGKKLGVDLGRTYDPTIAHPYWSTKPAMIKLENAPMFFDDTKPQDFVKIKNLKASKFVANSLAEKDKWPEATHVMFDEADEVKVKATKVQIRNNCYALAAKMTADDKINIIQILGNKNARGRSNEYLDVTIDELIEEDAEQFMKYAKMDNREASVRSVLLFAISKGVLTKEGNSIYYMGERIGFDMDEAVAWFGQPDNQKMKVLILEKLGYTKK